MLPDSLKTIAKTQFAAIYELKPPKKHVIQIMSFERQVYRYQRNYMNTPPISIVKDKDKPNTYTTSYMFSGIDDSKNNGPLPHILTPYYDHVREQYPECDYNQVSVNWYDDGADYIAFHRDCEIGMKGNRHISILTLNEDANDAVARHMTFKLDITPDAPTDATPVLDFPLFHGSILTIGGDTQKYYRHGIKKTEIGWRRVSMSFRQFEDYDALVAI